MKPPNWNAPTLIPLCGKTNIAADGVLLAAVDGLRHDCRD
jgi:hypothetical protein